MVQRLLLFLVAILLAASGGVAVLAQSIEVQPFPVLYFYVESAELPPQMRMLDSVGQVHDVFAAQNDGFINDVSPDGEHLAFGRYQWDVPRSRWKGQLWIADLRTQKQAAVSSFMYQSTGKWSPDGASLLIRQAAPAMSPFGENDNYDYHSIYSVSTGQTTVLGNLQALSLGWYSDSQRLLLWNEANGYFKYSIADQTIEPIAFESVESDAYRLSTMSPQLDTVAILGDEALGVYDAENGRLLRHCTPANLDDEQVQSISWSPDGRYLALKLTNDKLALWDYGTNRVSWLVDAPAPLSDEVRYYFDWSDSTGGLYLIGQSNTGTVVYQLDVLTGQSSGIYTSGS